MNTRSERQVVTLSYGRWTPAWWSRHSRALRLALILALGVVVIGTALRFGEDIASSLSPARVGAFAAGVGQRGVLARCHEYEAPPRHVVYEEGPNGSTDWVTPGSGFAEHRAGRRRLRSRIPECLRELLPGTTYSPGTAALFVHEMSAPSDGSGRLVIVYHHPVLDDDSSRMKSAGPRWSLAPDQVARPGWNSAVLRYHARWSRWLGSRQVLRLYAGQLDPADPAHIEIEYEVDGRRGFIDGYLRADGRLQFSVRGTEPTEPTGPTGSERGSGSHSGSERGSGSHSAMK